MFSFKPVYQKSGYRRLTTAIIRHMGSVHHTCIIKNIRFFFFLKKKNYSLGNYFLNRQYKTREMKKLTSLLDLYFFISM